MLKRIKAIAIEWILGGEVCFAAHGFNFIICNFREKGSDWDGCSDLVFLSSDGTLEIEVSASLLRLAASKLDNGGSYQITFYSGMLNHFHISTNFIAFDVDLDSDASQRCIVTYPLSQVLEDFLSFPAGEKFQFTSYQADGAEKVTFTISPDQIKEICLRLPHQA